MVPNWMNYKHDGESFDLKGLLYLNRADKTAFQDTAKDNYSSLLRMEEMPSTTWGADFQGTIPFGAQTKFTLGAAYKEASWDYDDEYASTRDVGAEGKQRFISPFANLDFRLLDDNLIVNLGARYDWIETSDGSNWDSQGSAGKPAYDNTFDSNTEGNYVPNSPRHKVHFGFRYQNPKIVNVSVIGNYYADVYFDNENTLKESGYFTMDATISRKFFDRVTAYINAENLLDEEYPIFRSQGRADTIAPGLIVTSGVKFEF
jgi:outer membrane receptor protein involved in Fe transport